MKEKIRTILSEHEQPLLVSSSEKSNIKELIIEDLVKLFNEEFNKLIEEILLPAKEKHREF